jgi:hypothetical protein
LHSPAATVAGYESDLPDPSQEQGAESARLEAAYARRIGSRIGGRPGGEGTSRQTEDTDEDVEMGGSRDNEVVVPKGPKVKESIRAQVDDIRRTMVGEGKEDAMPSKRKADTALE